MEFFKKEDFNLFARVRKQPYKRDNEEHQRIGSYLKLNIFQKTSYWAELLKAKGYETIVEERWQMSGYFSGYSWARILLPGIENRKVFFTIGVGSRFTENGQVATMDYKLDCQRSNTNPLNPSMIYVFDKYMGEYCAEARLNQLLIDDVKDWNDLVEIVLDFIRTYQYHYLKVAELTHINSNNLSKNIVRLCWNKNGWKTPSGPEGKSVAKGHAFERDKGYGYEEWLFNPAHIIDGYHYGFIQALHKGGHHGKSMEISAYAIENQKNKNTYYWIAKIANLEVLTTVEQEWVINQFHQRGLIDQMRSDLQKCGVEDFNFEPIDNSQIINVRYRVDEDNWVIYDKPILITEPKEEIGKNKHYVLLSKIGKTALDELPLGKFTFRAGHTEINTKPVLGKKKKGDYLMRLKHKEIQGIIYKQLELEYKGTCKQVGTENKTEFGTSIDLVVKCENEGVTFYEIKTYRSALQSIRESIGQLFEYSYYMKNKHANKLVVIGLEYPSQAIKKYIYHLREILDIEVYYQYYNEEKMVLLNILY